MSVDLIRHYGTSAGRDSDALIDSQAADGLVDEPLRYKFFNGLFHWVTGYIRDIVQRSLPTDATELDCIKGLFTQSNSCHSAFDTRNRITASTFGVPNDLSYTRIDGARYLLAAVDGVNIYDIDNMVEGSQVSIATLLVGLPGTLSTDIEVLSLCNDGEFAYLLIKAGDPDPDEFYVQSYRLSDWAVNPSWPATGVQLDSYATSFETFYCKLRFADDTRLFVTQPWVTPASSPAVRIITAEDGTIEGSRTITAGQIKDACANGDYIFAVHDDGSGNIAVTDIDIDTPAAGTGWTWGGSSAPTISVSAFTGVAACGDTIVYTATDDVVAFNTIYGGTAHGVSGNADLLEFIYQVVTDGKHFYALGARESTGTASAVKALYRLDFVDWAGFNTGADPYYEAITDMEERVTLFKIPDDIEVDRDGGDHVLLLSDGPDIWMHAGSGSIVRTRKVAK